MRPLRAADKPWIFTGIRGKVLVWLVILVQNLEWNGTDGVKIYILLDIICCQKLR